MDTHRRASICAAVLLAAAASLLAHSPSMAAAARAAAAPAKPNIFGIWLGAYVPGGDERWRSTPLTPKPEFTAWGKAESERWNTHETPGQCEPWTPLNFMLTGQSFPVQILDGINQVVMIQEVVVAPRRIYTDGRKAPEDPDPSFMGYSVGRWEGDTLVVETAAFNGKARPLNGYPAPGVGSPMPTEPRLPASDQLRMIERYRLVEPDVMEGVFVVMDPKAYTTPSFSTKRYYRRRMDADMVEYVCTENERVRDEGQSARQGAAK